MIYKLEFGKHYETGLGDDMTIAEFPDVYLHFGHHAYSYEWNPATKRHEEKDAPSFFGGCGEGQEFSTWNEAVLVTLYDAFQVYECFHDGDVFQATYNQETRYFLCQGVHVIETSVFEQACNLPGVVEL